MKRIGVISVPVLLVVYASLRYVRGARSYVEGFWEILDFIFFENRTKTIYIVLKLFVFFVLAMKPQTSIIATAVKLVSIYQRILFIHFTSHRN